MDIETGRTTGPPGVVSNSTVVVLDLHSRLLDPEMQRREIDASPDLVHIEREFSERRRSPGVPAMPFVNIKRFDIRLTLVLAGIATACVPRIAHAQEPGFRTLNPPTPRPRARS